MSAIYTYGQWIDIVDRGTSGDQVMDILASWKVDAYKLLEDNHKLEAELARRDEIITRLKEDAEKLSEHLILDSKGYFPHIQEQIRLDILAHRALMKELE